MLLRITPRRFRGVVPDELRKLLVHELHLLGLAGFDAFGLLLQQLVLLPVALVPWPADALLLLVEVVEDDVDEAGGGRLGLLLRGVLRACGGRASREAVETVLPLQYLFDLLRCLAFQQEDLALELRAGLQVLLPEESLRGLANFEELGLVDEAVLVEECAFRGVPDALQQDDLRDQRDRILGTHLEVLDDLVDQRLVGLVDQVDRAQYPIGEVITE